MKSKSLLWILIAVMIFVAGIFIRYINTGIVTAGTILGSLAFTLAFSLVYFIGFKLKNT
ncbi:hypothetical protein P4284_07135 [Bacillus swezeyi]|uniref:hypothetical protein n=1 Tax=Bacillus swezeyi TaxID=1925020 RepID=UPI002E1AD5B5|nr:hypothetical protein [Bacillus swezeyi]